MLTRTEILAVPPGPQLDALVAEHVMGIRVVSHDWPCGYLPDGCEIEAAHRIPTTYDWYNQPRPVFVYKESDWPPKPSEYEPGTMEARVVPVPFYSTEIAAAWKLVDRLADLGHVVTVKADGLRSGDFQPRYTVLVSNRPRVDGKTAAEAIARAALLAVTESR